MIADLFAGPGGWSEALRQRWPSHHEHEIGFEWSGPACTTRGRAGHLTIRADVAAWPLEPLRNVYGLIASPPCQTFSLAGGGAGRRDLDRLIAHAHRGELYATPDPRTGLVLEPLRWIHDLDPRWIVLEQVPAALPVWHAYEHHLRGGGYSTWSGILNAADYGVPQTRRRAVLIASLDRPTSRPHPTHEENPDGLFDLAPWVSMADALGWGETVEIEAQRGTGMAERHGPRPTRRASRPAPTITGGAGRRLRVRDLTLSNGMNTMKTSRRAEDMVPYERPLDRPSPTVDGKAQSAWRVGPIAEAWRRLTIEEILVFQSFRTDYPLAGNKGERGLQVGNAIPPKLAEAILDVVL